MRKLLSSMIIVLAVTLGVQAQTAPDAAELTTCSKSFWPALREMTPLFMIGFGPKI